VNPALWHAQRQKYKLDRMILKESYITGLRGRSLCATLGSDSEMDCCGGSWHGVFDGRHDYLGVDISVLWYTIEVPCNNAVISQQTLPWWFMPLSPLPSPRSLAASRRTREQKQPRKHASFCKRHPPREGLLYYKRAKKTQFRHRSLDALGEKSLNPKQAGVPTNSNCLPGTRYLDI
jgi:hypothetical protein